MANEQVVIDQLAARIQHDAADHQRELLDIAQSEIRAVRNRIRILAERLAPGELDRLSSQNFALDFLPSDDYLDLIERALVPLLTLRHLAETLGVDLIQTLLSYQARIAELESQLAALAAENVALRSTPGPVQAPEPTPAADPDEPPEDAVLRCIASGEHRWWHIRDVLSARYPIRSKDLDDLRQRLLETGLIEVHKVTRPRFTALVGLTETGRDHVQQMTGEPIPDSILPALLARHPSTNGVHALLWFAAAVPGCDLSAKQSISGLTPACWLGEKPICLIDELELPAVEDLLLLAEQTGGHLYAVVVDADQRNRFVTQATQASELFPGQLTIHLVMTTDLVEHSSDRFRWTTEKTLVRPTSEEES